MRARKVLIGCAVVVLVLVGLALVSGVTLYMSLSGRAPLPSPTLFVDENAVGVVAARLAPDDPWVIDTLRQLGRHSVRQADPNDILPAEAVWTAARSDSDDERYMLTLSLSPKGKLLGMIADIGLWKAGWAPDDHIARVTFEGEGITSFPGTKLPGQVFIRDNVFVWTSDLDTARRAVTRMNAPAQTPPADAPILALMPDDARRGHAVYGALSNREGSLARSLALVPGQTLDLPVERLSSLTGLSFVFDPDTARTGKGRITLRFADGTPAETVRELTADIAGRIAALHPGGLTFETTANEAGAGGDGAIEVRAEGLDGLKRWIEAGSDELRTTLEKGAPPAAR